MTPLHALTRELCAFANAALLEPADLPDDASSMTRRRVVCGLTVLAGSGVLAWSLGIAPGDPQFYPATAALAATWLLGALLSGPLPLGQARRRSRVGATRGVLQSLILGLALLALFLAGAVLVARIPVLAEPVQGLLDHARFGSLTMVALITAVNGVSEEVFFRGALFAALPRGWRVAGSTVVYTVVTALSGIPLLALAGLLLGLLVSLQRRATGGFLPPVVTHLTWSLGMLFALPPVLTWAQGFA